MSSNTIVAYGAPRFVCGLTDVTRNMSRPPRRTYAPGWQRGSSGSRSACVRIFTAGSSAVASRIRAIRPMMMMTMAPMATMRDRINRRGWLRTEPHTLPAVPVDPLLRLLRLKVVDHEVRQKVAFAHGLCRPPCCLQNVGAVSAACRLQRGHGRGRVVDDARRDVPRLEEAWWRVPVHVP